MTWIAQLTVRGLRHIERWDVTLPPIVGPSHAVLVGPSGSGKSSVLGEIAREVTHAIDGAPHPAEAVEASSSQDERMQYFGRPLRIHWTRAGEVTAGFRAGRWVAASLEAARSRPAPDGRSAGQPDVVRPDARVSGQLASLLCQRAADLALAERRGDHRGVEKLMAWRGQVQGVLRRLLGDEGLGLAVGERDAALDFSDGRRLPFEALSSGHAAAVDVWAEVFLRVEASRVRTEDSGFDPTGVLLVDAVEAFLDPRLQRTLLRLLAERFPGVQILASTSSPIVASSLPGATLLDLGARTTRAAPSLPPPAPLPSHRKATREGPGPWED